MADTKIVGGRGLGRDECEDEHEHKKHHRKGLRGRSFRYTVTGDEPDLSNFMVTLPVPETTDTYKVFSQLAGASFVVGIDLPDIIAADRTQFAFRVVTTASMTVGDQIDFLITR